MSRLWWIIAAVVVVAAVGAGTYVFFDEGVSIPAYTPPAAEPPGHGVVGNASLDKDPYDVVIKYTDNGFVPQDLTVTQGTRVRFLNDSHAAFWPASGVHPTHSLYPEKETTDCLGSSFDACQDVAPGEYFDFTFYYTGTWPCHDHLEAYNICSITVTDASSTP